MQAIALSTDGAISLNAKGTKFPSSFFLLPSATTMSPVTAFQARYRPKLGARIKNRWTLSSAIQTVAVMFSSFYLIGCSAQSAPQPRTITLQQQWALNPGDDIAGNIVSGSLGDISIHLKQGRINAPFPGVLEPSEMEHCALYSTPEIPAYLFRFCGLKNFAYGDIKTGKRLGKGSYLSFATLRRQPDGTWIIVEPARGVLEKALAKNTG